MITTKSLTNPATEDAAKPPVRHHPLWRRKLASVSRWLHVYLSMTSFAILLFFAVTGLTLNHQDWFNKQQKTVQSRGALDAGWLKGDVDKLRVVEFLRGNNGLHGALDDFRIADDECSISFKGPGYEADVVLDRSSGNYDITETHAGMVAIFNDLHKGRDTGFAWSIFIDVSAVLLVLISLTGLVLLFYLKLRRGPGLVVVAVGTVVVGALFYWGVP